MSVYFINGSETVEAIQFFPDLPWPEGVKKWTDAVPRDMSWGYVDTERGRIHVHSGDWIMKKENGQWDVSKAGTFQNTHKPIETKQYPSNRRARLDLIEPSEKAIYDAMVEVEKVGADVRLTKTVVLLQEAREQLADYFDEKLGVKK